MRQRDAEQRDISHHITDLTAQMTHGASDTSTTSTDEDDVVQVVIGLGDGCHPDYRVRSESSHNLSSRLLV